jgi:hypothetical protein
VVGDGHGALVKPGYSQGAFRPNIQARLVRHSLKAERTARLD